MSGSTLGIKKELKASKEFHSLGIPLLVSPKILRTRNLGQIDLARLIKKNEYWIIQIAEVKSSEIGKMQMQRSQKYRIYSSQIFLSSIFGLSSEFSITLPKSD